MMNRGKAVPGGACGFWGACGAGISTGMFISIISGATPLKNEPWGLDDPTGKSDDDFKVVIQQIEQNIIELKNRLSEN